MNQHNVPADRTASMVSKTATSIGHRMASLTFDKKFQQVSLLCQVD